MQLRADSYLSAFSFLSTYVEYESWRCTAISELMINEQIRDKEVRLIGENGEQLGIMSAKDAYKMARDAELDLVRLLRQRSRRYVRSLITANTSMR